MKNAARTIVGILVAVLLLSQPSFAVSADSAVEDHPPCGIAMTEGDEIATVCAQSLCDDCYQGSLCSLCATAALLGTSAEQGTAVGMSAFPHYTTTFLTHSIPPDSPPPRRA